MPLRLKVPIYFSIYIVLTLSLLSFTQIPLPVMVTNILSLSYAIFFPLFFILKPLGLTSGEIWAGPTVLGVVVGLLIYDVILFLLISLSSALIKKRKVS